MFRKKLFMPVIAAAFAATAFGQIGQRAASSLPATATTNCQSTFTAGKDDSFLQFCVTANGNVTEFQSPQGVEHIREGGYIEGYAICTTDTLHNVGYFDLADLGDSGNWHDPVHSTPANRGR